MNKDEVAKARERKRLERAERKFQARQRHQAKHGTPLKKAPPEPPLWLKSGSLDPITTPMYPTQVPFRPVVLYTDKAWAKIQHLIRSNTLEVGWWGTVRKDGSIYTIEDVFVPKQVVSGGTTDISGDGLNKIVDDLLVSQGHADNLLYWGHLHPTFSCSPSHTDEKTTQGFVDSTLPGSFFIRGIYNKKGESKVDIYQKDTINSGWIFQSVDNKRIPAVLDSNEFAQFREVCKQNVSEYIPPVIKTENATGSFSRILPSPDVPGLYRHVEGSYPIATQDLIDDLDDSGVISAEDLEILHDPLGVKGEGYGPN